MVVLWSRAPQDLKLDVLVYCEIGMHPFNYMLAFSRLAPVQIVTHGVSPMCAHFYMCVIMTSS